MKFVRGDVRPPNFEAIPITPLTTKFLQKDTIGTWIKHVREVLSTYRLTEAEACNIMVKFIHVQELQEALSGMLATASLEQCAQEALRLGRLWRPSRSILFPKPEGQSYVTYLEELRRRAEASGTTLGDKVLVDHILSQMKDDVMKQRLLDYEDDLDALVEEADNTVCRMTQLAKYSRERAPAETRIEAVKRKRAKARPAQKQMKQAPPPQCGSPDMAEAEAGEARARGRDAVASSASFAVTQTTWRAIARTGRRRPWKRPPKRRTKAGLWYAHSLVPAFNMSQCVFAGMKHRR